MTESTPNAKMIEVTFRLPAAAGATRVSVAGDFNGWSRTDHPMTNTDDGLAVTIALEPGRWYRYRYWVDDNRWENDWTADWYTPNAYGGDDSVVDLTDESPRMAGASAASPASTASTASTPSTPSTLSTSSATTADPTPEQGVNPTATTSKTNTAETNSPTKSTSGPGPTSSAANAEPARRAPSKRAR